MRVGDRTLIVRFDGVEWNQEVHHVNYVTIRQHCKYAVPAMTISVTDVANEAGNTVHFRDGMVVELEWGFGAPNAPLEYGRYRVSKHDYQQGDGFQVHTLSGWQDEPNWFVETTNKTYNGNSSDAIEELCRDAWGDEIALELDPTSDKGSMGWMGHGYRRSTAAKKWAKNGYAGEDSLMRLAFVPRTANRPKAVLYKDLNAIPHTPTKYFKTGLLLGGDGLGSADNPYNISDDFIASPTGAANISLGYKAEMADIVLESAIASIGSRLRSGASGILNTIKGASSYMGNPPTTGFKPDLKAKLKDLSDKLIDYGVRTAFSCEVASPLNQYSPQENNILTTLGNKLNSIKEDSIDILLDAADQLSNLGIELEADVTASLNAVTDAVDDLSANDNKVKECMDELRTGVNGYLVALDSLIDAMDDYETVFTDANNANSNTVYTELDISADALVNPVNQVSSSGNVTASTMDDLATDPDTGAARLREPAAVSTLGNDYPAQIKANIDATDPKQTIITIGTATSSHRSSQKKLVNDEIEKAEDLLDLVNELEDQLLYVRKGLSTVEQIGRKRLEKISLASDSIKVYYIAKIKDMLNELAAAAFVPTIKSDPMGLQTYIDNNLAAYRAEALIPNNSNLTISYFQTKLRVVNTLRTRLAPIWRWSINNDPQTGGYTTAPTDAVYRTATGTSLVYKHTYFLWVAQYLMGTGVSSTASRAFNFVGLNFILGGYRNDRDDTLGTTLKQYENRSPVDQSCLDEMCERVASAGDNLKTFLCDTVAPAVSSSLSNIAAPRGIVNINEDIINGLRNSAIMPGIIKSRNTSENYNKAEYQNLRGLMALWSNKVEIETPWQTYVRVFDPVSVTLSSGQVSQTTANIKDTTYDGIYVVDGRIIQIDQSEYRERIYLIRNTLS